ncbi:DUF2794 domain-containing protein [Camelimonas abortus]|uniref:DUF2794 domain-containing protein n=1 Tax=Camelimonas abortus TaxID=1017184 RepID=A0ABV7LE93_9HYPH
MTGADPRDDDSQLQPAGRAPAAVIVLPRARAAPAPAGAAPPAAGAPQVSFSRLELNALLDLYGRHVATGAWRDYAIDFQKDRAVFSIFRRTSEAPLYAVVKCPRLERRQGAWSVSEADGRILKRGNDLKRVLAVIDRPLRLVKG